MDFDRHVVFEWLDTGQDAAALSRGVGRVFEEVHENPLDQIAVGQRARRILRGFDGVPHFGMGRFEECDSLFHKGVKIERLGTDRRFRRELRESPDATFQRLDFIYDDRGGLIQKGPLVAPSSPRATISSTVSRMGVREFFTSWAILRANTCQLASCVR